MSPRVGEPALPGTTRFTVDDRVVRPKWTIDRHHNIVVEGDRLGTIREVRTDTMNGVRHCNVLYSIEWDDAPGIVEHGYLETTTGLQPAPLSMGGLHVVAGNTR